MPRRKFRNKIKSKKKKNQFYKKATIPKAIREQCWIKTFGQVFEHSCYIHWCDNEINVFNFHVGHDKPESKGGTLSVDNLKPICARCNLSMSNNYTIQQWNQLNGPKQSKCFCF
tara:strand:- start:350 stop:691 length:342 start_codon:yes stop_codon:yes gene_type:complete